MSDVPNLLYDTMYDLPNQLCIQCMTYQTGCMHDTMYDLPKLLCLLCQTCCIIMEYGSTPYIGMAPKKNGCPIVCVQSDMFQTALQLVICFCTRFTRIFQDIY